MSSSKSSTLTLSQRERRRSAVRSVVVLIIALICAVPLWYILINTFKTVPDMVEPNSPVKLVRVATGP